MGAGVGGEQGVRMESGEVEGVGGEVTGGQLPGEWVPLSGSVNAFLSVVLTRAMRGTVPIPTLDSVCML